MPEIDALLREFERTFPGTRLEQLTTYYLSNDKGSVFSADRSFEERITEYIQKLLPLELAFARFRSSRGELCLPKAEPIDCLVMLQGYSWEPLLQSIAVYQPRRLVMVVSKTLKPRNDFSFQQAVELLASESCRYPTVSGVGWGDRVLSPCPLFIDLSQFERAAGREQRNAFRYQVAERPHAVFSWIRKVLQDHGNILQDQLGETSTNPPSILLDITGAKKSMVAGAYVYAAFSGTNVTYVDFDEYDELAGRPKGYSCRISRLLDPISAFRIRDWRAAVVQFTKFQFDAAKRLFAKIRSSTLQEDDGRGAPSEVRLFPDGSREAQGLDRLLRLLEMYHQWDNGDYHGAAAQFNRFKELFGRQVEGIEQLLPEAVNVLSNSWPDDGTSNDYMRLLQHTEHWSFGSGSLYLDNHRLLHYAFDEREKIERLVNLNEDFRSAFLRAHGLSETLMKARLLRSWYANHLQVRCKDANFCGDCEWHLKSELESLANSTCKLRGIEEALGHYSPVQAGQLLRGSKNAREINVQNATGKKDKFEIEFKALKHDDQQRDIKMREFYSHDEGFWQSDAEFREPFSGLRNGSIHFCLSIPRPLAKRAQRMVQANLKDFIEHWLDRVPDAVQVDANQIERDIRQFPSWNRIANVCELTFLPVIPDNELRDEKEQN